MGKRATIQYREARTNRAAPGLDLKATLVDVLRRRSDRHRIGENARLRAIDLDGDGSHVILNKVSAPASWNGPVFCGQILHIRAGADIQAVLQSLDDDTDEFLVRSIDVGPGARVVKGVLYFAVSRNHLGLIEGAAARAALLERYLTALLRQAGALNPADRLLLVARLSADGQRGLAEFDEFTMAARPGCGLDPAAKGWGLTPGRGAGEARDEGATVFDVLRMMGWPDDALTRLKAEVPPDGRIEGLFRVFIRNRRSTRRIPRAAIEEALRHVDPADLGLRGDGRERGGIVRLSVEREIATEGSLLDPSDAMVKIVEALKDWASMGRIDCRFEDHDMPC